MKNIALYALSMVAALPLLACGAPDEDSSTIAKTGTVSMPLVAQSTAGLTYRLRPASFRIQGGAGVDRVVGGGTVDILTVDLAPGDYTMQLRSGWQLNVVENGADVPVMSVMQSANPQNFHIDEGLITDIVFRFGVGPDAIAFGLGRGRVSIEVDDGCPFWYRDLDSDGFGDDSAPTRACFQVPTYAPVAGDCNDADGSIHPGATELCNGADDDCNGTTDGSVCQRRAFTTSTTRTISGGVAAADAFCQARADSAGLGGVFRAWLSTSTVDARDRLNPNAGPFVGLDGTPFANNVADLTDGTLSSLSLRFTETLGHTLAEFTWTGTLADGTAAGNTCADWTSTAGTTRCGIPETENSAWTDGLSESCGSTQHHYCFED